VVGRAERIEHVDLQPTEETPLLARANER